MDSGEEGRFRAFDIDLLRARDFNLDIRWLKETRVRTAEELPEPEALVQDVLGALQRATAALELIEAGLENGTPVSADEASDGLPLGELGGLGIPSLIGQLRQSILAAAFRGSLTAAWRETCTDLESIEDTVKKTPPPTSGARGRPATKRVIPGLAALSVGMPDIEAPPGWSWFPLTRVAALASGHTPSRKEPAYWGGEFPWIGIGDAGRFHGGIITETSEQVTQEGINNSATRLLPPQTVCLSRTASIGYVVIMGREMCTSQDFVNWICSPALVPEFLALLFVAERPILHRFASGVSHNTIYFPEVKALHVCLPPVREQQAVVATVERWLTRLDGVSAMFEDTEPQTLVAAT
jgi:type I restriction enzyme S subunit